MATWGYGLLGPVEVRVDGRPVPLPGVRQRLLLAMLLVNANRTVPAVRVIDELWGADLPADPRAALRTQVSRLRRALGPAGRDLATLEGGYRLAVPRGQLDFCRFEDALAEAAKAGGEPALRLLDEALALYRGPALGEFADRPFPWLPWTHGMVTPRSRSVTMNEPSANGGKQGPGPRCGSRSDRWSNSWRGAASGTMRPFSTER